MGLLKLTAKVPASQKPAPIPRAIKPPQKPKAVRSLVGLSQEEIEEAIEKEYIDRGAILFRFESTSIKGFKLSCDGRFGIRHNEKLSFFQLIHFRYRQKLEDFRKENLSYDCLKWIESTQINFYYNEEETTADMQMREIAKYISRALGSELEEILEKKRKEYYDKEDADNVTKFEASIIHEELHLTSEGNEETTETESIEDEKVSTESSISSTEEIRDIKVARENKSNTNIGTIKLNIF